MEFLQPTLHDAVARTSCTAIVVWPGGDIATGAFVRLLPLSHRPRRVLLVRVRTEYVPHVRVALQAQATVVADDVQLVDLRFGFDDDPDIPLALSRIVDLEPSSTQYIVVDDRVGAARIAGLPRWRRLIFAMMSAACEPASAYFHLPQDRTMEVRIGRQSATTGGVA